MTQDKMQVMALRLPLWQINGLKIAAKEDGTTVSALLREHVTACLQEHGITETAIVPLPGQCMLDV